MPENTLNSMKPRLIRAGPNPMVRETRKVQIERIMAALEKRNIRGHYCDTPEEIPAVLEELVPEGAVVGLGGTVTLGETGALDALRERAGRGGIRLHDRYGDGLTPDDINAMRRLSLNSDVFISSTNAITRDGVIVNADGIGNRVAAQLYGPARVILIVGANKIVRDLEEAITRIRNVATPMNALRFGVDTPCGKTGFCPDNRCPPSKRLDKKYTIIEAEHDPGRFHVIFVNGSFGF